jgi:hypothetical protein
VKAPERSGAFTVSEMCRRATLEAPESAPDLPEGPPRSLRRHYVITVMGLHRAASACTNTKTPHPANALAAGSLGTSSKVPPAGFEPAHTAPEGMWPSARRWVLTCTFSVLPREGR